MPLHTTPLIPPSEWAGMAGMLGISKGDQTSQAGFKHVQGTGCERWRGERQRRGLWVFPGRNVSFLRQHSLEVHPTPLWALRIQWTLSSDRLSLSDQPWNLYPVPASVTGSLGTSAPNAHGRSGRRLDLRRLPALRPRGGSAPYLHSLSRQTFRLVFREPAARIMFLGNH